MIDNWVEQKNETHFEPLKGERIISTIVPRNSMIKGFVGGKVRKVYSDEKLNLGCVCQCKCPDHLEELNGEQTSISWTYGSIFFWYVCY